MARKSNTIIGAMPESTSRSVEVRKIGNGYIKRESSCDVGGYSSHETFHKENPGLENDPVGKAVRGSTLQDATQFLKGKK